MKQCSNCGHGIKEGDAFCPECGTTVAGNGEGTQTDSTTATNSRGTLLLSVCSIVLLVAAVVFLVLWQNGINRIDQLTTDVERLDAEYSALELTYEELSAVFPPRDFDSVEELQNWLANDTTDSLPPASTIEEQYSRGLKMQLAALNDGFIISIDQEYINEYFFFILGIAVIDGNTWVWQIDTDEIYQPIGWGPVTRE